ncbi:MAG: hypothetical protein JKY84_06140, partial [Emcibacteraceae bacterium]|nr:hypothetical protein [Emcibacteraceae bacterium]
MMNKLSRRGLLKSAVTASIISGTATMVANTAAAKPKPNVVPELISKYKIANRLNFPKFIQGDVAIVDETINEYQGEGWYLWDDGIYKAEPAPILTEGFYCVYQYRGHAC